MFLLFMLGFLGFCFSLFALIKGKLDFLKIKNRKTALIVFIVSCLLIGIGAPESEETVSGEKKQQISADEIEEDNNIEEDKVEENNDDSENIEANNEEEVLEEENENNDEKVEDEKQQCPDGTIAVNTASENDLQKIEHIGPDRAEEIIRLRENRAFNSYSDMTRITGIGPARADDIEKQGIICFD